jgi:hypothetical protein
MHTHEHSGYPQKLRASGCPLSSLAESSTDFPPSNAVVSPLSVAMTVIKSCLQEHTKEEHWVAVRLPMGFLSGLPQSRHAIDCSEVSSRGLTRPQRTHHRLGFTGRQVNVNVVTPKKVKGKVKNRASRLLYPCIVRIPPRTIWKCVVQHFW